MSSKLQTLFLYVIPAQAGISGAIEIPAFAGMTDWGVYVL